jgi:hypothetical protein
MSAEVVAAYRRRLDELSARDDHRRLLDEPAGVDVRVENRHGLVVLTASEAALANSGTLEAFRRFRLMRYLEAALVDPLTAARAGWVTEPAAFDGDDDLHIMALSSGPGRLVSSVTLHRPDPQAARFHMETRNRPLLTVEETFGWGVCNGIEAIRGLSLGEIREIKRLVCDRRATPTLALRAIFEVLHQLVVIGIEQSLTVRAYVGDFEPTVVGRAIDALGVPWHLVDACPVRCGASDSPTPRDADYLARHYQNTPARPFVILIREVLACGEDRLRKMNTALASDDAEFKAVIRGLLHARDRGAGGAP